MSKPWKRADTTWFRDAQWGVFVHFLGELGQSASEWNKRVDHFDVDGLARQLADAGARYFFLTVGQTSGHYCAPNSTYDEIVGRQPSLCSERDLMADMIKALKPYGIRMMAYIPSDLSARDEVAAAKLRFLPANKRITPEEKRLAAYQTHSENIVREWSQRWGKDIHGWWVDGCYHADDMYRHTDAPNFQSYAEAMKSGNPDAIVAFNPGVKAPVICYTEYEDYTAGELSGDLTVGCWGHEDKPQFSTYGPIHAMLDGAQYHVLNFLGPWWCSAPVRFPDALVVGYTQYITQHGGVVTWDVAVTPEGLIQEPFMRQLSAIGDVIGR